MGASRPTAGRADRAPVRHCWSKRRGEGRSSWGRFAPPGPALSSRGSVADLRRQLLGVLDPAPHASLRRQQAHKLVLLVGLAHGGRKFADIAVLQLPDGVYADGL